MMTLTEVWVQEFYCRWDNKAANRASTVNTALIISTLNNEKTQKHSSNDALRHEAVLWRKLQTSLLFICQVLFFFYQFCLKNKTVGGGSLKRRFLLNCHKYSFIKMWNNQIFYIFAFMDNQTAADDFWHQTNVSWILQRVTFPLIRQERSEITKESKATTSALTEHLTANDWKETPNVFYLDILASRGWENIHF